MNPLRLLLMIVMVECQTEDPSVCGKLQSIYRSICMPVEDREDSTDVQNSSILNDDIVGENCQNVADIFAQNMEEKSNVITTKYTEITNDLTRILEDINRVEENPQYCPIRYNGKCFWIGSIYDGISCDYARDICVAQGGKMADIYSEDHYYMVMGYMRTFAGAGGWMHAWLGMTYDRQTNGVFLSNGTRAPFTKWHPGLPNLEEAYCCCIAMTVSMKWRSEYQHLFNARNELLRGVVCEK